MMVGLSEEAKQDRAFLEALRKVLDLPPLYAKESERFQVFEEPPGWREPFFGGTSEGPVTPRERTARSILHARYKARFGAMP